MPHQNPKTDEERRILKAVSEWLLTAQRAGYKLPLDAGQFAINMHKSSLLRRLLDGKEPYPFPPPKRYSYPWYSLLEAGEDSGYLEPWEASRFMKGRDDELVICQSLWTIVERLGEGHYHLQYNPEEGSVWELKPMTVEEVYAMQRPRTIKSRTDEQVWETARETQPKYGHLRLITPGKNTLPCK